MARSAAPVDDYAEGMDEAGKAELLDRIIDECTAAHISSCLAGAVLFQLLGHTPTYRRRGPDRYRP